MNVSKLTIRTKSDEVCVRACASVKETYYKAKETYYKEKETYYKAKETYYKEKETYYKEKVFKGVGFRYLESFPLLAACAALFGVGLGFRV